MIGVPSDRPLVYPTAGECRRAGPLLAVHEPTGPPRSRRPRRPSASRVRLHLAPGQRGTKQLLAEYGDRLVCVRYRYDAQRGKRLKTVELIVAERDWQPSRPDLAPDQIVAIRVAFAEAALRERVKQAGGVWNPERRVWQVRYDRALALGLSGRIVDPPISSRRCGLSRTEDLHADAPPIST